MVMLLLYKVRKVKKHVNIIPIMLIFLALVLIGLLMVSVGGGRSLSKKALPENTPKYGMWDEDVEVGMMGLPDDETLANRVDELLNVESIPVVNLSTEVAINDKEKYENLLMSITDKDNEKYSQKNLSGGIRARGNSTLEIGRQYGPMPFKIKLDEKVDLLGMGESKKWCLIANFIDRSYVKQFIMYQTAQLMMGEEYFQPQAKYVEVYMNGEYKGLYLLTESIEEDEGRLGLEVELEDYEENVPFLLEMEQKDYICEQKYKPLVEKDFSSIRFFADSWVEMPGWLLDDDPNNDDCSYTPFDLKYPESFDEISYSQEKNIRHTMNDVYESAKLGVSINQLGLDLDSFVNYYLHNEVFSNPTFVGPSVYMYREPNSDRLRMGPLWDFDTAMFGGTEGSVDLERNTIYKYLYKYRAFRNALAERYQELEERLFPLIEKSIAKLGENKVLKTAVMKAEAKYNTWGRSLNGHNGFPGPTYDIPDSKILSLKSYEAHVGHISDWLFNGYDIDGYSAKGRVVWLGESLRVDSE